MFAPLVFALRQQLGSAQFNQLRGQAIALHCRAITHFCHQFGLESQQRQGLIRLAKSNGQRLGLLA